MTAQPHSLHVELEHDHTHVRLRVSGELDLLAAPSLTGQAKQVSLDGNPPTVVIDLSDLAFIDAAGLRALLDIRERLRSLGHQVRFDNVPPPVARLVDILDIRLQEA